MRKKILVFLSIFCLFASASLARFVDQSPGGSGSLSSVYFINDTTGLAIGGSGKVYKTTNRGVTWTAETVGNSSHTWNGIDFVTTLEGYIAGSSGGGAAVIYRTTDSGATWAPTSAVVDPSSYYCLNLTSTGTGGAGGEGPINNITRFPLGTGNVLAGNATNKIYGLSVVDGTTAFACGDWQDVTGNGLYKTIDGGATWIAEDGYTQEKTLNAVQALSLAKVWAVGATKTVVKTTNGGTDWTLQNDGITALDTFTGLSFYDSANGWLVASGGNIYRTFVGTAGTTTWELSKAETGGYNLYDVYALDANNAWFVGNSSSPVIFKWVTDPTITSVSPIQQAQGWNGDLTFTGTNFQSGMTVTADASGITFGTIVLNSSTSATVEITIAGAAPLGARTFYILNPDTGTGSLASAFTVAAAQSTPEVTSVSLNSRTNRPRGWSGVVTIEGTGFVAGATVTTDAGSIIPISVSAVTATTITGIMTIDATATTGAHSIIVSNTDGGATIESSAFTVNPKPTISSVSPSSSREGTTLDITITGSGFLTGLTAASCAFSSTGVTVNSLTRNGDSLLTVNITIASGGPYGARNITITNPDTGVGTGEGVFSVSANVAPPIITSLSPGSVPRGRTLDLTFTGSNFHTGATASLGNNGVTVNSVNVVNSTTLTVNTTITSDATTGWRTATVTNTDDSGVGSLSNALLVTAESVTSPTVTGITPGEIDATASSVVSYPPYVLTGTGFQRNATVNISNATASVAIENVEYVNATNLRLSFTAPTTAGTYNIRVTNPDGGSGIGSNLLSVSAASNSLSIKAVPNSTQVGLPYPSPWNPLSGDLTLSIFASEAATININAYDLSGSIVFRKEGVTVQGGRPTNIKLERADWDALRGLPSDGMLIFIISSGGRTLGKLKVMVQNR